MDVKLDIARKDIKGQAQGLQETKSLKETMIASINKLAPPTKSHNYTQSKNQLSLIQKKTSAVKSSSLKTVFSLQTKMTH